MSVVIIVFDHRRRLIGLPNSYESLIQKARTEFNLGDADLLVHMTGETITIDTKASASVAELKNLLYESEGVPPGGQRLIFQGKQMTVVRTLASYSVKNNDLIHFVLAYRGAKPAIYLMSPAKLSAVTVDVTLTKHWEFSILYPIVEPTILSGKSSAKWQVSVSPDGTLETLEASGPNLECSYLLWEAKAVAGDSIAPELLFNFPFNPQRPLLCFKGPTALILSFDDFLPYLEKVLQTLTLTPAMRTELIVYWLPKFMKIRDRGQDIAFDFVPQSDFQKVAHLEIEPRPDTVARVFLIFRGAFKQTHGQKTLAELEAIDWSARIGIDVAGMKDTSTFRALEWGGMEVITV
ncbi:hypothetical protein COL26b_012634 [Colletotrichum chrysophilum]|uniref:uncharacterized protein n=1 Tax=Colletotrichum chrysophilum TaxID=1836956 RepID=UPI002301C978|nr:uncharacterized protein COL26b_012634 [Colletotrichum chrysophilum]KAJ0364091.1 hypothetical protein COL26b_012634 [Colletotrichum chrysophilum]